MIRTEGTTIHLTRGDATNGNYNRLAFNFPIYNFETEQEENYLFQLEDKISFTIINKKGYTKEELLRKEYTPRDIGYAAPTDTLEIPLTEEDTKSFPLANKPKTYWYQISLNDSTTVLGYDDDGAKLIIVYPEVEEV